MSDKISPDIVKSTSRLLISHVKEEYNELCANWRDVERKAQTNLAIIGIFIAGILLVLRIYPDPSTFRIILVFISLLLLSLTAIFSLLALMIKEVDTLEDSRDVLDASQEIFNSKNDKQATRLLRNFVSDRLEAYNSLNRSVHSVSQKKAKNVYIAQWLLITSIISVATLMTTSILSDYTIVPTEQCLSTDIEKAISDINCENTKLD